MARESVTMPTGQRIGDPSALVRGMLFGVTDGSPSHLFRWSNPDTDLTTYDTVIFPADGTYGGAQGMVYDATTDLLYLVFNIDLGADPFTNRIVAIDPDTLAYSTFANDALGTAGLNPGPPAITSDGTHLYVATKSGSETSWVYKYLLATGAQVASRQISGTVARRAHTMQTDGTRLYIGGTKLSPTTTWVAWVEQDLSADSVLTVSTTGGSLNDDSVLTDTHFWIGLEAVNPTNATVAKIPKDLSSVEIIDTGVAGGGMDGIVLDDTGTSMLVGVLSTPSTIVSLDPDTGDVLTSDVLEAGEDHVNELLPTATDIYLISYTTPSWVTRMPLPLTAIDSGPPPDPPAEGDDLLDITLAGSGTTGTGRFSAAGMDEFSHVAVVVNRTAIGATPAISWTVQGSLDGTNWTDVAYVTSDATVASSKAPQTTATVAQTILFVDGLDKRRFTHLAVNVSANTNITFNAKLLIRKA